MEEKFIPWIYQEFPKALTVPGTDKQIVVANADEESAKLAEWGVGDQDDDPVEREGLLSKADELGLKIDRRWSDKRLAQEIEAFETSEAMKEPE